MTCLLTVFNKLHIFILIYVCFTECGGGKVSQQSSLCTNLEATHTSQQKRTFGQVLETSQTYHVSMFDTLIENGKTEVFRDSTTS